MKKTSLLIILALALPAFARSEDYNLGELAKAEKIDVFNRALDQTKAASPEVVFLDAATGDGLAWISGVEFSDGSIELEIKGRNRPGQSFVGIAFHGRDDQTFDAVYLRPFNFQAATPVQQSRSVQYISLPGNHWNDLRTRHPNKYESAISPAPDPEAWVKLKLVIAGRSVAVFVNGSDNPALTVDLLNDRLEGKVGLWVGNGSDGWFRNLKITTKE